MKEACHVSLISLLPNVFGLVPSVIRMLWQPPLPSLCGCSGKCVHRHVPINAKGQAWDVDITARFFGYAAIGWSVVELAPRVFASLRW